METEMDRLFFIACRDGYGGAIDFAKRTMKQYELALEDKKHFANLPQYKPAFEASIKTFGMVLEGKIQF